MRLFAAIAIVVCAGGRPTFVGGNLGVPLAEAVGTPAGGPGGICVVEASSFQLETVETMRPRVAVLLNVTADHLDRYPDLEAYGRAKTRIFAAQTAEDFAVVNLDDALCDRLTRSVPGRRLGFSTTRTLAEGGWIDGESLCVRLPGTPVERYPARPAGLVGRHNQENALAALIAARLAGATATDGRAVLTSFRPLAHRMELVAEQGDVATARCGDRALVDHDAIACAVEFPRIARAVGDEIERRGHQAPHVDLHMLAK